MRATWTGFISFGLVTLPVQLFTATEEHGAGFHQVHASDGARIRHRKVREREDVEVPQSEIARGWERPDGRTVVLLDEDLAALPIPTRMTVKVLGFVDERDVDPVLVLEALLGRCGRRAGAAAVRAARRGPGAAWHGRRGEGDAADEGAPGGAAAAPRDARPPHVALAGGDPGQHRLPRLD
ncbi:hypothetical protein OG937_11195 [Streptomyces sp. NBC_00510]